MLVRTGERTHLDARAKAEPAPDRVMRDYYTRLPQIRVTADTIGRPDHPSVSTEIMLDSSDVGRLIECAIQHPSLHMRNAVLSAIWNHPETFRRVFEFGLDAPEAFGEIRAIVAEALAKRAPPLEAPAADNEKPLLPRMPLPAHLKDRGKQS